MTEIPEDRRAPDGCTWFCTACGKWAEDRYGMVGQRSKGWDVSCMINAAPSSGTPPWRQDEIDPVAFAPRAADYLGAKNDPVGPTSGHAVAGKSRRLKRKAKS